MIKAVIADTERSGIEAIETMLSDLWPELVICGKAASGPEALHMIDKHRPQLAFLEVRLPEICGMQVARIIAGACQVVFTTNHAHYAVNAFDSGARDYLLKPLDRDRLQKAIHRVQRDLVVADRIGPAASTIGNMSPQTGASNGQRNHLQRICIQNGRRSRLVSVEEVHYFRSDHKYTAVIFQEDEALINKSIKSLMDELDPHRFWRIHRSTIVNVDRIESVSRSRTGRGVVRLKRRTETLTVSRPYLHLFRQM